MKSFKEYIKETDGGIDKIKRKWDENIPKIKSEFNLTVSLIDSLEPGSVIKKNWIKNIKKDVIKIHDDILKFYDDVKTSNTGFKEHIEESNDDEVNILKQINFKLLNINSIIRLLPFIPYKSGGRLHKIEKKSFAIDIEKARKKIQSLIKKIEKNR